MIIKSKQICHVTITLNQVFIKPRQTLHNNHHAFTQSRFHTTNMAIDTHIYNQCKVDAKVRSDYIYVLFAMSVVWLQPFEL